MTANDGNHLQPRVAQLVAERLEQRALARAGRPEQQRQAAWLQRAAAAVQDPELLPLCPHHADAAHEPLPAEES